MEFKDFLKDSNGLIHIESERILNGLKRTGFVVTNENESKLFISMAIESIGNKLTASFILMEREELDRETVDKVIAQSLHVCGRILQGLNGHPIDEKKICLNTYSAKLFEQEVYLAQEILSVTESVGKLK